MDLLIGDENYTVGIEIFVVYKISRISWYAYDPRKLTHKIQVENLTAIVIITTCSFKVIL